MRQKRISYWLRGIALVLGVMGVVFFGALTRYGFLLRAEGDPLWGWVVTSWYIAVCCYLILFEFWRVSTQIGRNNSFSAENAASFHRMGLCGIAGAVGFAARIAFLFAVGAADAGRVLLVAGELLLALIFTVLCEALARLVRCAYEMKQENELTI